MSGYGFDPTYVTRCIQEDRHNHATTTYFLALKGTSDDTDVLRDKIAQDKLAKLVAKSK